MEATPFSGYPPESPEGVPEIDAGIELGASDWHMRVGLPTWVRVAKRLEKLNLPPLTLRTARHLRSRCRGEGPAAEGSFSYHGQLLRLHAFTSEGAEAINLRRQKTAIPSLAEIGAPPAFIDLVRKTTRGLILCTGPTGAGKSTTLAAAIEELNGRQETAKSILVFSNPIEFQHSSRNCSIRQLEKGLDFESFVTAMEEIGLRGDPDVIVISEMRNLETINAALHAAATGHLVFGTLHNATTRDAVARILGTTPKERVGEIRSDLANHLAAVLAQQLVRGRKGGLHAAFELMLPTSAVRALLADGSDKHLPNELESRDTGMISMDRSLAGLVKRNLVDRDEALRAAVDRAGVAKWLAA